jgi:hypothetical protein
LSRKTCCWSLFGILELANGRKKGAEAELEVTPVKNMQDINASCGSAKKPWISLRRETYRREATSQDLSLCKEAFHADLFTLMGLKGLNSQFRLFAQVNG